MHGVYHDVGLVFFLYVEIQRIRFGEITVFQSHRDIELSRPEVAKSENFFEPFFEVYLSDPAEVGQYRAVFVAMVRYRVIGKTEARRFGDHVFRGGRAVVGKVAMSMTVYRFFHACILQRYRPPCQTCGGGNGRFR